MAINYNKTIYNKKVGKDTILYILGRFLKEHNAYHLWKYCSKHYSTPMYTWENLVHQVEIGQFVSLINCAPFSWGHETISYDNEEMFMKKYSLSGHNGMWNHYQFWHKLHRQWIELFN